MLPALAPLVGARKVTTTPGTGLPPTSRTVTISGVNEVPTVADWGVPEAVVMVAAPPGLLVKIKDVEPAPAALAVTVYVPASGFACRWR